MQHIQMLLFSLKWLPFKKSKRTDGIDILREFCKSLQRHRNTLHRALWDMSAASYSLKILTQVQKFIPFYVFITCTLFFIFYSGRNERLKSSPWLVISQVIALAHPSAFCHKDPLKLAQFSLTDFCIWPPTALNWGIFANLSSQYWIFCQISPNLFSRVYTGPRSSPIAQQGAECSCSSLTHLPLLLSCIHRADQGETIYCHFIDLCYILTGISVPPGASQCWNDMNVS